MKKLILNYLKLIVFWVLLFDLQKIIFTLHNFRKFEGISLLEWLKSFYYSLKLDIGTAAALSILPVLVIGFKLISSKNWVRKLFYIVLMLEVLLVAMIHCGEVNAYEEWNSKLTSRVFNHLRNPDEVFRTAGMSMYVCFGIYLIIECVAAFFLMKKWFPLKDKIALSKTWIAIPVSLLSFLIFSSCSVLLLRGGFQPIPMNINQSFYSKYPINNDVSVNSVYYFAKSFMLYNRTNLDEFMPDISLQKAEELTTKMMNYPKEHSNYFLTTEKPNIVFVIFEGWSGQAISSLSTIKNSTPNFDAITKEGVLFTNIYAASGTSEIGNSTIFSGFPGIPEVSITMQPEKSRNIRSINQDLKLRGYTSSYLFSGDLKYGNIGGYFLDHGFDVVKDEKDFPTGLKRGKLNYYDDDLYDLFIQEIRTTKTPFLQCAFTGSTHAPYDHPKAKRGKVFDGEERDYMNSLVYADEALGRFIEKVKKEPWFDNTLFIFVSDHGHATPLVTNPASGIYNHIPLLFWGNVIDSTYRGKRIEQLGSQADIAATLFKQLKFDEALKSYPWSKDLMNPLAPQFALHTITRGYGWITPTGNFSYEMQSKVIVEDNFPKEISEKEHVNCFAFLTEVYQYYKQL